MRFAISDRLTGRTFDVLVVGGGIYGLTIAYDAAQRGLSVALIERDDFGSGSSFNHLRTIHGGLRYLQTLDSRARANRCASGATLARIAPHAVRAAAVRAAALPIADAGADSRCAPGSCSTGSSPPTATATCVPALRLPAGRVVSRQHAIERFPGLRRRGLTGAAVWHDYVTTEADRLTFSWALAAAAHGAVLANHVEAPQRGRRGTAGRRRQRVSIDSRAATFEIAARVDGQRDGRRRRSPARARPASRPASRCSRR